MKKLKAVSLCIMVLMLCGCSMKYEYNMSIKSDKSMDFSIISAMDNELIDGMLSMETDKESYTDEERWQMLEESMEDEEEKPEDYGFTVSKYEEGEFKGYKYSKKIANIDDISGETANFNLNDFANISESVIFVKDGEKYKANFVMSNEEQSSSTQGYDIGIDMMFTVTLPNKPISHNATSVSDDGKTLTWNLLDSDSQNIEFEFSLNKNNMLMYILIGAGALLLIVVVVVIISSKGKKNKNTVPNKQEETNVENQPSFLEPKESLVQQPTVEPVVEQLPAEPQVNQPIWSDTPVQPIVEPQMVQSQSIVEPQMAQPQSIVEPQMAQPQSIVEPQMVQPQPMVEPQMAQPQSIVEPQNNQPQGLPSVDDILNIANQNNPNNN